MTEVDRQHVFVTTIGTGNYLETTYVSDGASWTSRFAPVATARLWCRGEGWRGARAVILATDEAKANEMTERSGQMGVPVIDINGTIIVGFDKEAISKALSL